MQDQTYLQLSIEFFELASSIQELINEGFGVNVKIFDSIEQVILAKPQELMTYLEALRTRMGAYINIIASQQPDIISGFDKIETELLNYSDLRIDNSAYLSSGKAWLIQDILDGLIETTRLIHSCGYTAKPFQGKGLVELFLQDTESLVSLRTKVTSQLRTYKIIIS